MFIDITIANCQEEIHDWQRKGNYERRYISEFNRKEELFS
jgi:hypothetical protein